MVIAVHTKAQTAVAQLGRQRLEIAATILPDAVDYLEGLTTISQVGGVPGGDAFAAIRTERRVALRLLAEEAHEVVQLAGVSGVRAAFAANPNGGIVTGSKGSHSGSAHGMFLPATAFSGKADPTLEQLKRRKGDLQAIIARCASLSSGADGHVATLLQVQARCQAWDAELCESGERLRPASHSDETKQQSVCHAKQLSEIACSPVTRTAPRKTVEWKATALEAKKSKLRIRATSGFWALRWWYTFRLNRHLRVSQRGRAWAALFMVRLVKTVRELANIPSLHTGGQATVLTAEEQQLLESAVYRPRAC